MLSFRVLFADVYILFKGVDMSKASTVEKIEEVRVQYKSFGSKELECPKCKEVIQEPHFCKKCNIQLRGYTPM